MEWNLLPDGSTETNYMCNKCNRMGSEKRNIFGKEIQSSVSPGPAQYEASKGLSLVKGKMAPNITMGHRLTMSFNKNPEELPGPGSYDNDDET